MRFVALFAVAVILQQSSGCDQTQTASVPQKPAPYQRFIPMPRQPADLSGVPWSGAFALDTKTGQLCFTYIGTFAEPWNSLPQCLDLLKQFPD
jgi:hypothetical protein